VASREARRVRRELATAPLCGGKGARPDDSSVTSIWDDGDGYVSTLMGFAARARPKEAPNRSPYSNPLHKGGD
jgi:hypothetical protein